MDRLFKLCDPGLCIKKFHSPGEFDSAKVKAWIECLVSHNIQQLEIAAYFSELPHSLLACKTLVDLKLYEFFSLIEIPTVVSLPNLKTLHIGLENYANQGISSFLSGCPILEELYLEVYIWYLSEALEVLNISVPSLKKLSMHSDTHSHDFATIIVAPLLEYLDLDTDTSHISLNTMPSLVEAHLDILALEENDQLWKLLSHISDIKCLTIPDRTIEYLGSGQNARHLPQFPKMELLTIGRDYHSKTWIYANLPNQLDRMPKLNHIVFKKVDKASKFVLAGDVATDYLYS